MKILSALSLASIVMATVSCSSSSSSSSGGSDADVVASQNLEVDVELRAFLSPKAHLADGEMDGSVEVRTASGTSIADAVVTLSVDGAAPETLQPKTAGEGSYKIETRTGAAARYAVDVTHGDDHAHLEGTFPSEFTLALDPGASRTDPTAKITWSPAHEARVYADLLAGGTNVGHADDDDGELVVPTTAFGEDVHTELHRVAKTQAAAGAGKAELTMLLSRESDLRLP